jgi:hypothetical protein
VVFEKGSQGQEEGKEDNLSAEYFAVSPTRHYVYMMLTLYG